MTHTIHYEKYDEPKMAVDHLSGKMIEMDGEYKCTHPQVDKIWLTGSGGKDTLMKLNIHVMTKNGSRFDFQNTPIDADKDYTQELIDEATSLINKIPE